MKIYIKSHNNGGTIRVGNKNFPYRAFSIVDNKIIIYGKTKIELFIGVDGEIYKNGYLIFVFNYSVEYIKYKKSNKKLAIK